MDVTAMLFARITSAPLAAGLAQLNGSSAVFSDYAPAGFVFPEDGAPALIIAAATADDADDLYSEARRTISQDVRLYAYDTGSSGALDTLAQGVRSLFHGQEAEIHLTGGRVVICTVAGPVAAPTTNTAVIGRRLTLNLLIEEA